MSTNNSSQATLIDIEKGRLSFKGGMSRVDMAEEWKPTWQEWMVFITLALVHFMTSLDSTIIITSLSTIVRELGANSTQGFWIGTAYLLTCAVTMPFTASLSNIFGRTWLLFSSILFFTAGAAVCSIAQGIGIMLVGRTIQGVGGGGVIVLSNVIFADIVPSRQRPKYIGVLQTAWATGTSIGPIVGGYLATPDLWRWVFYLMFPFCGLGLIGVPLFVKLKVNRPTWREVCRRIDWVGGFLFISSATGFLFAISWGGSQEPWDSWRTIVPLVVGGLGIIATMLWEIFGAHEPFIKHSLFYCTSSYAVNFGAFLQGLLLYGQLYYLPFFFESVKFRSPMETGISMLPVMLSLIPATVGCGAFITRVGRFRWAIWTGWILVTLATGMTIAWDRDTSTDVWIIIFIVLGFGYGMLLSSLNCASQAVARQGDEGHAMGMYAFLRAFGMAMGVGIGGSVFQNLMRQKLLDNGLDPEISTQSEAYVNVLRSMPEGPQRAEIMEVYIFGFRGVFSFFCALAALGLVLSFFVKSFGLNKRLSTEHQLQRRTWPGSSQMLTDVSTRQPSIDINRLWPPTPSANSSKTFVQPRQGV